MMLWDSKQLEKTQQDANQAQWSVVGHSSKAARFDTKDNTNTPSGPALHNLAQLVSEVPDLIEPFPEDSINSHDQRLELGKQYQRSAIDAEHGSREMKFRLSNECKELIHDKWGHDFLVAELICKDLLKQHGMNALRLGCTIGVFIGLFSGKDPNELIVAIEDLVF